MQLTAAPMQNTRVGTCPHGLPLGACPICNGMSGGGGAKKADFSAKPGEMSWSECAAIGAFLKAQKEARVQRRQDFQTFAQNALNFQNALANASQKIALLAVQINNTMPAVIAKPVSLVLNLTSSVINTVKNTAAVITNTIQTITQKFADISDKLSAVFGELKASVEKKISEAFNSFKKKIKSLFEIFNPQNADDDDKKVNEAKKAFELKTFIHKLYKKIKNEKDLEENDN